MLNVTKEGGKGGQSSNPLQASTTTSTSPSSSNPQQQTQSASSQIQQPVGPTVTATTSKTSQSQTQTKPTSESQTVTSPPISTTSSKKKASFSKSKQSVGAVSTTPVEATTASSNSKQKQKTVPQTGIYVPESKEDVEKGQGGSGVTGNGQSKGKGKGSPTAGVGKGPESGEGGGAVEKDCLGIRKNAARMYVYLGIVAMGLLLIAIIAAVAAVAASGGDVDSSIGVRVNERTPSPTVKGDVATTGSPSNAPSTRPSAAGPTATTAPSIAALNETSAPTTEPLVAKFEGSKPNIMFIMMDDLGYHDVGYVPDQPRAKVVEATTRMTKLAKEEGMILTRMYAHWHCSPSRRSFLTGRLPHRTGEDNSDTEMDDIDLRWTWVSEKLQGAGYKCYMLGKGHTGYKSYNHIPERNGFDRFVGLLVGKAPYQGFKLWKDGKPEYDTEIKGVYSTKFYRQEAVAMLDSHRASTPNQPWFMFLSMQTPHTPIEPPPSSDSDYSGFTRKQTHPYEHMLYAADIELQRLVDYLKRTGMWSNTLFIFSSDNGATTKDLPSEFSGAETRGSNYPLRGDKSTNFEGGLRATAFVSGGVLPAAQRGTINPVVSHIADWYATFCFLAGVDPSDGPSEQPLVPDASVDVLNPSIVVGGRRRSLWGDNSYPAPDSKNLMPHFVEPDKHDPNGLRPEGLVLDFETIILGDYKLITAQPCPLEKGEPSCKKDKLFGWIRADAKSFDEPNDPNLGCLYRYKPFASDKRQLSPCLFNLKNDMREERPITNEPEKLAELWEFLNKSIVYQYNTHLVGKEDGLSPKSLLGTCVDVGEAGDCFDVRADRDELPLCGIPRCPRPRG